MRFDCGKCSAFGFVVRTVGMSPFKAHAMRTLAVVFLASLFVGPLAMGQTRKYKSITWAKFNATGPELKQIGRIAVRHAKDIKSSPWSVGCETLDRDQAKFSVYKDYVGELGVKHGRLQSGWAKCEKTKGVYDFAWLDECVHGLDEQGVEPWVCLCYGNPLYGSSIHLGAGMGALVYSEEAMAGWLKYVEATVTRYKDTVKTWEVWNEPNGHPCAEYAILLMKTSEVIKKVQPDAVIMGLSLAGVNTKYTAGVFDILKANGKLDCFDLLTYHPYTRNPDTSYSSVDKLKQVVDSYNPNIKLYQGENGCPSILEWTHALAHYPWTEYSQAKWFLRRMAGDGVRGIPSSVFTIIDLRYSNMLQSFGLIRSNLLHQFIYKRPSYHAVQHMAGFFDDMVKPVGLLPYESNSPRQMTVAGFEKQGTPVVLVWYNDKTPSDDLKWDLADLTINGAKFQDPVYVEMITGRVLRDRQGEVRDGWRKHEADRAAHVGQSGHDRRTLAGGVEKRRKVAVSLELRSSLFPSGGRGRARPGTPAILRLDKARTHGSSCRRWQMCQVSGVDPRVQSPALA